MPGLVALGRAGFFFFRVAIQATRCLESLHKYGSHKNSFSPLR